MAMVIASSNRNRRNQATHYAFTLFTDSVFKIAVDYSQSRIGVIIKHELSLKKLKEFFWRENILETN